MTKIAGAIAAVLLALLLACSGSDDFSSASDISGTEWLRVKYESLSSIVPYTNAWRFSDPRAADTMHAALWNGSAWDLHLSNRLAVDATLKILIGKDELLGKTGEAVRVLDAGCGWGGTIFFAEGERQRALAHAPSSRLSATAPVYEGITLSPTQADAATASAATRGLSDRVVFRVASFESLLPREAYAAVFAIEALEHSSNLSATLFNIAAALRPGGALVLVTDLLAVGAKPTGRQADVLQLYREHWCGPHTQWAPPASLEAWRLLLADAQITLMTQQHLSAGLYQRPRWALGGYLTVLRAVHHVATALRFGRLAMQASNQLGGVSRELLLHDRLIEYTLLVGRRASRRSSDGSPLEGPVRRPALSPPRSLLERGVELAHTLLVQAQNVHARAARSRGVQTPFPPSRRPVSHCSESQRGLHLVRQAMAPKAFARAQPALAAAVRQDGLCYDTAGRRSCILSAAQTGSTAPDVREWHHDPAWAARLSALSGVPLHPLDDARFRMAFATHQYATGGFNGPHCDSSRTSGEVWTVILSLENNSTSHLVVDGDECLLPENAALLFRGSERRHWLPTLEPHGDRAVQRTIIFSEFTSEPPAEVRWSWPWRQTLVNAERIFL